MGADVLQRNLSLSSCGYVSWRPYPRSGYAATTSGSSSQKPGSMNGSR
jgi:hypothetical protein